MLSELLQQARTKDDVSILAAFALLNMKDHARLVDVHDFQGRALNAPHPGGLEGHNNGAVKLNGVPQPATASGWPTVQA